MNKEKIEKVFREAGVKPVSRERLADYDLYIGDGFSLPPHSSHNKFGVEPTDFPNGMYVTWWWIAKGEDGGDLHPLFFDVHHNPEYSWDDKKTLRVNASRADAENFLKTRNKHVTKH